MYQVLPSYALGFHGCDKSIAEAVFAGSLHLKRSENEYDWLGTGIYFWENSPARALEYAQELCAHPRPDGPKITIPAVVGAVIELGYCMNLMDSQFILMMLEAYKDLRDFQAHIGLPLPTNTIIGPDMLLRPLDCAVINFMHEARKERSLRPFDTLRSAFAEGGELYPGSGVSAKHHIQLCVRRRSCIKGYFRPMREEDLPTD